MPSHHFQPGNTFGKGRIPGFKGRTADLKGAQRKLQQMLDAELSKPYLEVEPSVDAPDAPIRTKAEKLVHELIRLAMAGKAQAIEIVLERWAGKPAMVEVEKAYSEPVQVTVEHVGASPRSESDVDSASNPFSTKAN